MHTVSSTALIERIKNNSGVADQSCLEEIQSSLRLEIFSHEKQHPLFSFNMKDPASSFFTWAGEVHNNLKISVLKRDLWPNQNEFQKNKTWVFLRTGSIIKPRNDFSKFVTNWKIFGILWSLIWQIAWEKTIFNECT